MSSGITPFPRAYCQSVISTGHCLATGITSLPFSDGCVCRSAGPATPLVLPRMFCPRRQWHVLASYGILYSIVNGAALRYGMPPIRRHWAANNHGSQPRVRA